jgi:hypothetical protein
MMGGQAGASDSVFFIKPNDKDQFKILPIMMSVLIDEDHIQDLLVELANSPMSIEVRDIEVGHPQSRVTKPEKGTAMAGMGGYGEAMMGGMMRGMMAGRMGREAASMGGYGGMMSGYSSMMAQMMRQGGGGAMMRGMMGGMGGMGGAATADRKGVDKRGSDRAKARTKEKGEVEAAKGPSLFDPYYDIVEVKVYGQARFYSKPPAEAETEPSPGEATTEAGAAAPSDAAKTETEKPGAPGEPGKTVEAAKGEPAKGEPAKDEAAKGDATKDEAPSPAAPGAPAKAEASKSGAPGEPAKTEPAKAGAPGEPAKTEPPKPAQTKSAPSGS